MTVVVDASVLLAVLRGERGWFNAIPHLRGARLSAVNFSEILAKASDKGIAAHRLDDLLASLGIDIVAFDREYADAAGGLRPLTRAHNISFADRACLAQAMVDRLPLVTADRDWSLLGLDVQIFQIR